MNSLSRQEIMEELVFEAVSVVNLALSTDPDDEKWREWEDWARQFLDRARINGIV